MKDANDRAVHSTEDAEHIAAEALRKVAEKIDSKKSLNEA